MNKLICGVSTVGSLYKNVNELINRQLNFARKSPTVIIDYTDANTPLPTVTSGTPTLLEFGICPFNNQRGLHIINGTASLSLSFPELAGMLFYNEAYVTCHANQLAHQQALQFRAYDTATTFWGMQNIPSYTVANGGDTTGGAETRNFNLSHRVAQGAPTTASSFTLFEGRLGLPAIPDGYDIWIFNIGFGQPTKGRICVVWDDGRSSSLVLGAPLLNSYGITKQTLALIKDRVGLNADYVTLGQCKSFINKGGCIVPHSPHLPNLVDQFPGNPVGASLAVLDCINYIKSLGLDTPNFDRCFVYPQGKYQSAVFDTSYLEALRAIGIDVARLSFIQAIRQQKNIDSHSRLGRLACTTIGHEYASGGESANITNIIQRINEVSDLGVDCFLMLHSVVKQNGQETDLYDISLPNLSLIAAAIKTNVDAGKLEAVTMADLVIDTDNYWNQF